MPPTLSAVLARLGRTRGPWPSCDIVKVAMVFVDAWKVQERRGGRNVIREKSVPRDEDYAKLEGLYRSREVEAV